MSNQLVAAQMQVEFAADDRELIAFRDGGFKSILDGIASQGGINVPIRLGGNVRQLVSVFRTELNTELGNATHLIRFGFAGVRPQVRQLRQDVQKEFEAVGKSLPLKVALTFDGDKLVNDIRNRLAKENFTIDVTGVVRGQMIQGGPKTNNGPSGPVWQAYPPEIENMLRTRRVRNVDTSSGQRVTTEQGFSYHQGRDNLGRLNPVSDSQNALIARMSTKADPGEYANALTQSRRQIMQEVISPMLAIRRAERDALRNYNAPTVRSGQQLTFDDHLRAAPNNQLSMFGRIEQAQVYGSAGLSPREIAELRGRVEGSGRISNGAAGFYQMNQGYAPDYKKPFYEPPPVYNSGAFRFAQEPAPRGFSFADGYKVPFRFAQSNWDGPGPNTPNAPKLGGFRFTDPDPVNGFWNDQGNRLNSRIGADGRNSIIANNLARAQNTAGYSTNLNDTGLVRNLKFDDAINSIKSVFNGGILPSIQNFGKRFTETWQKGIAKAEGEARRHMFAGLTLSMAFTYPAQRVATAGIQELSGFETTMARSGALTEVKPDEIKSVQKDILELSKTLPQTARQLGEGFYFIASNGLKGAQSMEVLKASGKGAAAGLGEVKDVADTTTSILAAYNMESSKSGHIVDVLTQAVETGKGEANEYAGAFAKVIPIASQAGIAFEEVAAAMSIMTRVGLSPSESATAFRQLASNLFAPSDEARKAMKTLGTNPMQLRQQIKTDGLAATLQGLMQASGGNVDILDKLVGNIRGLTGLLATAGSQSDEYSEALDKMYNSTGRTDRALSVMSKTLEFQWARMLNSGKATFQTIGQRYLPQLASDVSDFADKVPEYLDGFVEAWNALPPVFKNAVVALGGLLVLSGPMLTMISVTKNLQAALMLMGATAGGGSLKLIAGLAVGVLLLGSHFDATKDLVDSFTGSLNDSGTSAGSLISPMTALLGIMTALTALKMGPAVTTGISAVIGGVSSTYLATKRTTDAAKLAWSIGGVGGLGRLAGDMGKGRPAGMEGPLMRNGLFSTGATAASIAGVAVSAAAVTTAIGVAAIAFENYKQRVDEAKMANLDLQMSNEQIARQMTKFSTILPDSKNQIRTRIEGLEQTFTNASDSNNTEKMASTIGSLKRLMDDIKVKPDIGEVERMSLLYEAQKLKDELEKILKVKVDVENQPGAIADWIDTAKSVYNTEGLATQNDNGVSANGLVMIDPSAGNNFSIVNGRKPASKTVPGMPNWAKVPDAGAPNNNPALFTAPGVKPPSPYGKPLDKMAGRKIFDGMSDDDLSEKIRHYTDLVSLQKIVSKLDNKKDPIANTLRSELGGANISAMKQRLELLKKENEEKKKAGQDQEMRDLQAEEEAKEAASKIRRRAITDEVTMLDTYSNGLDTVMGKIREFASRTEESRVTNDMMKRSMDGLSQSYKTNAIALGGIYDRMKRLQDLKDLTKDTVGGFERNLISLGATNNPLHSQIAGVSGLMNYQSSMKTYQNRAQVIYGKQATLVEQRRTNLNNEADQLSQDGNAPLIGEGSPIGQSIAEAAWVKQAPAIRAKYEGNCQQLLRVTVQSVTPSLNKYFSKDTNSNGKVEASDAIRLMLKDHSARKYTDGMKLYPGDLLYNMTAAGGSGHAMTYGGGKKPYLDQYGASATPTVPIQYVYRPGGWSMGAVMGDKAKGGKVGGALSTPTTFPKGDPAFPKPAPPVNLPKDAISVNVDGKQTVITPSMVMQARAKYLNQDKKSPLEPYRVGRPSLERSGATKLSIGKTPTFDEVKDQIGNTTAFRKEWGIKPVMPRPGNESRMQIQSLLMTNEALEKVQKYFGNLPETALQAGEGMKEWAKRMWALAETTDITAAALKGTSQSVNDIKGIQSQIRMTGKSSDPFAVLEEKFRTAPDRGESYSEKEKADERANLSRSVRKNRQVNTEENNRLEGIRWKNFDANMDLLPSGAYSDFAMQRNQAGQGGYNEFMANPENRAALNQAKLTKNTKEEARINLAAEDARTLAYNEFDRGAILGGTSGHTNQMSVAKEALELTQLEVNLRKNGMNDEEQLNNILAARKTYLEAIRNLQGLGPKAKEMAEELALVQYQNAEDQRALKLAQDRKKAMGDLSGTLAKNNMEQFNLGAGMLPGSLEMKRDLGEYGIRQDVANNTAIPEAEKDAEITRRIEEFNSNLDTENLREFKGEMLAANDSMITFADSTGLAGKMLSNLRSFSLENAVALNGKLTEAWGTTTSGNLDFDASTDRLKSDTSRQRASIARSRSAFTPQTLPYNFDENASKVIEATANKEVRGMATDSISSLKDQLGSLREQGELEGVSTAWLKQKVQWRIEDEKQSKKLVDIGKTLSAQDAEQIASLRGKVEEQMKFNDWKGKWTSFSNEVGDAFTNAFRQTGTDIDDIFSNVAKNIWNIFEQTFTQDLGNMVKGAIFGKEEGVSTHTLYDIFRKKDKPKKDEKDKDGKGGKDGTEAPKADSNPFAAFSAAAIMGLDYDIPGTVKAPTSQGSEASIAAQASGVVDALGGSGLSSFTADGITIYATSVTVVGGDGSGASGVAGIAADASKDGGLSGRQALNILGSTLARGK